MDESVGRLFSGAGMTPPPSIYNLCTDMSRAPDHLPISELKNLGPVSARWLEGIDVRSAGDLRRLGPALAWRIVRERYPEANVLLLWAMAAGLEDRHWQSLGADQKKALRAEAESIRFGIPDHANGERAEAEGAEAEGAEAESGHRSGDALESARGAKARLPLLLLPFCLVAAGLLVTTPSAAAQVLPFSPLLEAQVYPAGGILVGGARLGPIDIHAGWNHTRRGNFGEHDNERGGGPGIGASFWRGGATSAPNAPGAPDAPGAVSGLLGITGLHAGLRLDVWYLDIDWWDSVTGGITPPPITFRRRGSTQVTVLQPTVRIRFDLPGTQLGITAAFGAEINVVTDGEDVGEGAIGLVGLRWGGGAGSGVRR